MSKYQSNQPISRVIELIHIVEFWSDALLNVRAERRDIIQLDVPEPRRDYLLAVNADLTGVIRRKLSDSQHDHAEAVRALQAANDGRNCTSEKNGTVPMRRTENSTTYGVSGTAKTGGAE